MSNLHTTILQLSVVASHIKTAPAQLQSQLAIEALSDPNPNLSPYPNPNPNPNTCPQPNQVVSPILANSNNPLSAVRR